MSCKANGPLIIIGNPRSGTSLLRLILTTHSKILIPPECGFILWLKGKYEKWDVNCNSNISMVESFLNDLFEAKKFETWFLKKEFIKKQINIIQPKNYSELCWAVYDSFGLNNNKEYKIWGDKNNFYLNYLDDIDRLYDNAFFLHIVRDGRDVACSYMKLIDSPPKSKYAPKLSSNIHDIAKEWSGNVLKINDFICSKSKEKAMTIKYEDLVASPLLILEKICRWMNLTFEEGMLDFYLCNKIYKLEPELTMEWKKKTLEPISNENVGRYIYEMNKLDQIEFNENAKKELLLFSYIKF